MQATATTATSNACPRLRANARRMSRAATTSAAAITGMKAKVKVRDSVASPRAIPISSASRHVAAPTQRQTPRNIRAQNSRNTVSVR